MERHLMIWSAFALIAVGMLGVFLILRWYSSYTQRILATNPAKAAFVSFIFFAGWLCAFAALRYSFPATEDYRVAIDILRTVGLIGMTATSIASLLFGGCYVALLVAYRSDRKTKAIKT